MYDGCIFMGIFFFFFFALVSFRRLFVTDIVRCTKLAARRFLSAH